MCRFIFELNLFVEHEFEQAFLHLQLYTPRAPKPHNKANLCCTTLQVAGPEPHMSGRETLLSKLPT